MSTPTRRASIADLKSIAASLGLDWEQALDKAQLSKASRSRAFHGTAGPVTIERIWKVLDANGGPVVHGRASGRAADPSWPISDAWRQRVRAELAARRWTQSTLAAEIATTRAAVSAMFNGNRGSTHVPAIHALFGWEPPGVPGAIAQTAPPVPVIEPSLEATLLTAYRMLAYLDQLLVVHQALKLVAAQESP